MLTDKPAVHTLLATLHAQGRDARAMAGTRIAALGAASLRLKEFGLLPDAKGDPSSIVGSMRSSTGAVGSGDPRHTRPAATRADVGRVRGPGDAVQLHQLVPHPELGRPLPDHDAIYFVGPSAVRAYRQTYGSAAFRRPVWCMGEQTQHAATGGRRKLGGCSGQRISLVCTAAAIQAREIRNTFAK